jgi:uncharacterized surface protein with fasciclin (FAS1) repeats
MTTSRLPRRSVAALAASAALTTAVAAPVAAAPAAAPAAKRVSIVRTAEKAGQFKTLVALVKRAGLARTLSGKGPYTVFAPTDAAFKKVPKRTLNALLKDRAKLRAVLLYHVAKGRVTSKKVVKLRSVQTLNGQRLSVRIRGGVFLGRAKITTPDVLASNGVIHVINKVLVPQS